MTNSEKKELDHINFLFSDAEMKKHCEDIDSEFEIIPDNIHIKNDENEQLCFF